MPPKGSEYIDIELKMEGPVAIASSSVRLPDGKIEESNSSLLVCKAGRWKVVIPYPGADADLTEAEGAIINKFLTQ